MNIYPTQRKCPDCGQLFTWFCSCRAAPCEVFAFDRKLPEGAVLFGAPVDAFARDPEPDGSRWVELAYAVSMVESEVTISKEDLERCAQNFARYPCAPVVIEHADTDWFPNVEWAKPHGHVEELRVGEREVTELDGSKRMAATLEGRVSFDSETAPLVGPKKTWRFGSVTLIKGATDEATGAGLGCLLWSWSLTSHPRLTGLTPIPASQRIGALTPEQAAQIRAALDNTSNASPRGPAAPNPSPPEKTMNKFGMILAALGLAAAASEEDAEKRVTAAAQFGVDALKALGLAATATPAEFAKRAAELQTLAAKVPAMETELATFRTERDARAKADRAAYLDDVIAANPALAPVRASLQLHADTDWSGFSTAYPRPSREDIATAAAEATQRAQDAGRTETVTANARTKDAPAQPKPSDTRREIAEILSEFGFDFDAMAVTDAIAKGHTPATLRAALQAA